ncbi:MAG TPA: hypothetical protein VK698_39080 [Kofleriaceae bacterium]|nr:hypothetical protein [Kofleriaceae bacterium]
MMAIYLTAMLVGGVLVALSIVAGADHGWHHGDVGGHGADGHAGSEGGFADAVLSWLPVGSFRFWTFFAAFFGLTGTALTMLGVGGAVPVAVVASAVGYASGLMLTRAIRGLQRGSGDSSVGEGDLVGATAQVLLPVGAGRTGKVRLQIKGRTLDLMAETEEEVEVAVGERVLVIAAPSSGHVVVARVGALA